MLNRRQNSCIRGLCCAVPDNELGNDGFYEKFGKVTVDKASKMTGVYRRYIVYPEQCTSDLCYYAAKRLLEELAWDVATVDGIIFVSQTPDYTLPATACILQDKLGLRSDTLAFDINLGCSGYVYGLFIAFSLVSSTTRRVLLLAGDTTSKTISPEDKSTVFLFGDAGSATAVEFCKEENETLFSMYTDGSGYKALIIPAGAFRKRDIADDSRIAGQDGIVRSVLDLHMDGSEVFNFTISKVPDSINSFLKETGIKIEDIDYFVPHQANQFMLNHIAKKINLPLKKMGLSIQEYGNTSSATIPLTLAHMSEKKFEGMNKILMAGFGVGLSWAIVYIDLKNTAILPIIKTNQLMPGDK